jgi:transposase
MSTRIIGIDLAITAEHRAAILDPASNEFVVKQLRFRAYPEDLDKLVTKARKGADPDVQLIVVLEATGMAWHPVASYLQRQGAVIFRVNGRKTQELRRLHHPHARNDTIDSQVLARLWTTTPDQLIPLSIPSGAQLTLERTCREAARYRDDAVAIENRLTAYDQWAWNSSLGDIAPPDAVPWIRTYWYDPWGVMCAGEVPLQRAWTAAGGDDTTWIAAWVRRARQMVTLFGTPDTADFPAFQATVQRNLAYQTWLTTQQRTLQRTIIQPLFTQLYPACPLESIYGIGADSAAIYMAFIHTIDRFANVADFRQWCGIVPGSNQSGLANAKGLQLTQAGPDLIKATLYLNANVARLWDPQLAKVYYTQMVQYGKHHNQAVCAVASHLANRIHAVLKANRPYVLRDLDGHALTSPAARQLIRERFTVPAEIRQRTNSRAHHRADWRQPTPPPTTAPAQEVVTRPHPA